MSVRLRLRPLAAVAALLAAAWLTYSLLLPSSASAHANLARADPEPNSVLQEAPVRVAVWFTEPVEPGLSEVRVLDSQAARVDDGSTLFDRNDRTAASVGLAPIPDGTYTVAWKNVSTVDGHLVRGSFVFSVGQPIAGGPVEASGGPLLQSPAEPVLRWMVLLGVLAMAGGPVFELVVLRPVLSGRPAGDAFSRLWEAIDSRSRRLTWAAVAVLLASSAAQLLVQTASTYEVSTLGALGAPAGSMLVDTGWGRVWIWRAVLGVAFAAAAGVLQVSANRRGGAPPCGHWGAAGRLAMLALAGAVMWTLSLTSHGAATAEIRAAALFADYLHLLAAAFWAGALIHLALSVPLVLRLLPPPQRAACLAAMVPRFSALAVLSVGALVVTGVFGAWAQVTTPAALPTPYGFTLAAKMILVLPLLILGGVNLVWVRPRLAGSDDAGRRLRRLLTGEAVLVVLVLASVGLLTSLEPARQVAAREGKGAANSLTFRDTAEGASITLEIEPGSLGPNSLTVSLEDRLGAPISNASEVSVRLTYLDADLGEEAAQAAHTGGGAYVLEGGALNIAGPWQAELLVRRPDAFDARTAFRFEIESAAGSASIAGSPATAKLLLGAGLGALGVLFMGTGLPLGGWYSRAGAGVMIPGVAVFLAGTVLVVNVQLGSADSERELRNPFPPNPESLAAGLAVYEGRCQTCHGATGRGDGPAAAGMEPPPADLALHVPLHADRDLFRFIHDGIDGSAMAPMGNSLTDQEIWHVVNYVKTLVR